MLSSSLQSKIQILKHTDLYTDKIQQDATYAGIYLLQIYSTCFGRPSHPSSAVREIVTAASGTGHCI
jgi:hypothetical protein